MKQWMRFLGVERRIMPSRIVKIEWDVPDDRNWLNKYSIELVLNEYCPNTIFEVTDIEDYEDLQKRNNRKMSL